jgi:hypothetical protein
MANALHFDTASPLLVRLRANPANQLEAGDFIGGWTVAGESVRSD